MGGGTSPREEGSVRILTEDEFHLYKNIAGVSLCYPTSYAIKQGAWSTSTDGTVNGYCAWWLRECRATSDFDKMVYATSNGLVKEYNVEESSMCMRSVMWVTGV